MKKQILTLLLVAFTGIFSANAQQTVSGVKVDSKLSVEGQSLMLNGAGLREKMWIDLYVGSLYLPTKTSNAKDIMDSKDAAAIKLDIVSGMITSEKMISAVNEGFENATNKNTAPLKAKIDKFKSFFKEEIKGSFPYVSLAKASASYSFFLEKILINIPKSIEIGVNKMLKTIRLT